MKGVLSEPTALLAAPFFTDAHRSLSNEARASVAASGRGLHDAKLVGKTLGKVGLLGLVVPESAGGRRVSQGEAAIDIRALCVAREELAYESPLADSIFAVQGLGSHPLSIARGGPERLETLSLLAQGDRVIGFALTEPEAGSDVAGMRTVATRAENGFVLSGEKTFISNVGIADMFVVFANADPSQGKRGISAFLVPANAAGLTLESISMSLDHPLGRLRLDKCWVPTSALIGEIGHGLRLALGTLDVFRVSVGAAAVGMARRAFDETVRRVQSRIQFGQPLVSFQLTQSALADMATDLEASQLLVARAAWAKDTAQASVRDVPMAKLFATEAAQRVIDRAVQLHGGLGVTSDCVVERLYREIRPLRIYEGTTEIQKLIIGGSFQGPKENSAP